jgi:hypothetical protein
MFCPNTIQVNYCHDVPYFSKVKKNTVMEEMFLGFTTRGARINQQPCILHRKAQQE